MIKREKGFSLIELLIVVAIILIIAAIAIPNLIRSRMAANEASAVGSIRTINTAEITFNTTYSDGFAKDLLWLGGAAGAKASCGSALLIDSVLGGLTGVNQKSGYNFAVQAGTVDVTIVPANCTAGSTDGYTATAVPVTPGTTGQRSFCSDASGVIRTNPTGGAPGVTAPLCTDVGVLGQ